jgi:two-component system, NarL family, response regulator LiaR
MDDDKCIRGLKRSRLVVADDHPLFRFALKSILSRHSDLEVIAEAADGREALELCHKLRPDLVLMDVRMPQMDGLTATRAIKRELQGTAVLIVTTFEDPNYLFEAIQAGAAGYVLKRATPQEIVAAVRGVLSGEYPLSREVSASLLRRLVVERQERPPEGVTTSRRPSEERPGARLAVPLAPREEEVLRLVAWGQTNQEIARNLFISTSTVKKHVRSIMDKLRVSDRTQAAVRAVELGLLAEEQERNQASPTNSSDTTHP